jgi:aspartate racemase
MSMPLDIGHWSLGVAPGEKETHFIAALATTVGEARGAACYDHDHLRLYLSPTARAFQTAAAARATTARNRERTMNTIGLLGGMSWESTAIYYRLINQLARFQCGRLHSAPLLMWSADFEEIRRLQVAGEWDKAAEILAAAACRLECAGAGLLVLCTNTMHKVAAQIEAAVSIPLLHLADVTAARIKRAGFQRVGFLGTRYAMEQDFYIGRLARQHLTVCTPTAADRDMIDHVIFDELCNGTVSDASRQRFLRVIEYLRHRGAEAVIAGCTEIGMLVQQRHTRLPFFDTTRIHAEEAVRWALSTSRARPRGLRRARAASAQLRRANSR